MYASAARNCIAGILFCFWCFCKHLHLQCPRHCVVVVAIGKIVCTGAPAALLISYMSGLLWEVVYLKYYFKENIYYTIYHIWYICMHVINVTTIHNTTQLKITLHNWAQKAKSYLCVVYRFGSVYCSTCITKKYILYL